MALDHSSNLPLLPSYDTSILEALSNTFEDLKKGEFRLRIMDVKKTKRNKKIVFTLFLYTKIIIINKLMIKKDIKVALEFK
jgi:hypothetical protein